MTIPAPGAILAGMTRAVIAHYLLRVALVLAGLGLLAMVFDVALGGALLAVAVLSLLIRLALTVEPAGADGTCKYCHAKPAGESGFCSVHCEEQDFAHRAGW